MSQDNTTTTTTNATTNSGKWIARYEENRVFVETKEKTSTGNPKRLPVKHRKIILEHTAGDRQPIVFGVTKTQYGWSIRDHRPMAKQVQKVWVNGSCTYTTKDSGNMKPEMRVVKQDKGESMGWATWKTTVQHLIGEDRADEIRVLVEFGVEVKYTAD